MIVAGSLLLMGQASTKKTVEANEFLLKDSSGKVRAALSVGDLTGKDDPVYSTAQLVLYDKDGKERAKIESGLPVPGAGPNVSKLSDLIGGGSLTLSDADGWPRVDLSADKAFGGKLSLKDEKGVPGTVLRANHAALPSVDMMDSALSIIGKDGKRLALLPGGVIIDRVREQEIESGLVSGVTHEHVEGGPGALLTDAGLSVVDEQGFGVAVGATELTTAQTGETRKRSAASIVLVDRNKTVLWKVP